MRHRPRLDANHGAIVAALRAVGCEVVSLAALGKGVPDLLVYRRGRGLLLVEVKDGAKAPSRRRLTSDEQAFGRRFPVAVVSSAEEALAAVGVEVRS